MRKLLLLLMFLYIGACTPSPESYLEKARSLLDEGRNGEAKNSLNKALETYPDLAEAYNMLGYIHVEEKDWEPAIEYFQQSIQLDSSNYKPYFNMGNVYQSKQNHQEALGYFNQAIERQPNIADLYTNRGTSLFKLGSFDEAISDFQFGIKLNQEDPLIHYNLGRAHLMQNQWQAAMDAFQASMNLDNSYAPAYYYSAIALIGEQDLSEACNYLEQAIALGMQEARIVFEEFCASPSAGANEN